jgi:hypothetical protein
MWIKNKVEVSLTQEDVKKLVLEHVSKELGDGPWKVSFNFIQTARADYGLYDPGYDIHLEVNCVSENNES